MAPRTRKPTAPPADATEVADGTPSADTGAPTDAEAIAVTEDDPTPETEPEVQLPPAPEDGVDYITTAAFSAQVGAQLVSFAEGVILDPLAGAQLVATGAPVATVAKA
jgi:hypothetical protein